MNDNTPLMDFGFSQQRGGAHLARTMMLPELRSLLAHVDNPDAPPAPTARRLSWPTAWASAPARPGP